MRLRSGEIWTIESEVDNGRRHTGVVVLSSGKLAGGDGQYLNVGRFRAGHLAADIKVKHYKGEAFPVFNLWERGFSVRFEGERHGDVIRGEMQRKDVPSVRVAAQMVLRGSIGPELSGAAAGS